jgi:glutathione S-transferase
VRGILHGVTLSPFVRKVRCVLALKGIAYELVNVMPGAMDARFRAKSPLSKIPVWEEGDWTLPDSSAIAAYLERIEPEPALYPSESKAYGDALFWEEYADTRLVDSIAPIFFQRVVNARVFDKASDEEIVRRQLDEVLPPVFDQIEERFLSALPTEQSREGNARGLEGAARFINIATLAMWSPLVNLSHSGIDVDAAAWPRLARFIEGMNEDACLRSILEEERASLAAH